jgi:hypothetical protein
MPDPKRRLIRVRFQVSLLQRTRAHRPSRLDFQMPPVMPHWDDVELPAQYNRLGAERLLIQNIIQSLQTVCLVPSLGYPTSVALLGCCEATRPMQ